MPAIGVFLAGCTAHPPTVVVEESCVVEHGYACDWLAALELAEAGHCDEELRQHWSAEIRRVCASAADGVIAREIVFGLNDVHFVETSKDSKGPGKYWVLPPTEDHRQLREFSFPAWENYPELTSSRDVTVVAATRLGVLVGIDQGEWGGGLIWLPHRDKPRLLVREPIRHIFELGGKVYAIGRDRGFRAELYEPSRQGPDRSANWQMQLRFRLPGWLLDVRELDDGISFITDAGTMTLDATGAISVGP